MNKKAINVYINKEEIKYLMKYGLLYIPNEEIIIHYGE